MLTDQTIIQMFYWFVAIALSALFSAALTVIYAAATELIHMIRYGGEDDAEEGQGTGAEDVRDEA